MQADSINQITIYQSVKYITTAMQDAADEPCVKRINTNERLLGHFSHCYKEDYEKARFKLPNLRFMGTKHNNHMWHTLVM